MDVVQARLLPVCTPAFSNAYLNSCQRLELEIHREELDFRQMG
eukprot:IDg2831t1